MSYEDARDYVERYLRAMGESVRDDIVAYIEEQYKALIRKKYGKREVKMSRSKVRRLLQDMEYQGTVARRRDGNLQFFGLEEVPNAEKRRGNV